MKIKRSNLCSCLTIAGLCSLAALSCGTGVGSASRVQERQLAPQGRSAARYASAPGFAEGPAWYKGALYFSSRGLRRVDSVTRRVIPVRSDLRPAGAYPLPDGRLLLCDNRHHTLLLLEPNGKMAVLADRYEGKPLRGLNDVTVDGAGNVYWTDPKSYDPAKPDGSVFRLTPTGTVSRIAAGLAFPNGIEVDPQSRFLFVVESPRGRLLRYPLPPPDKPLGAPTVFYRYRGQGDGLAFDARGNLWAAEFLSREVVALDGNARIVGRVGVPAQGVTNVAFGGPQFTTLFITSGSPNAVWKAEAGVRGFPGHSDAARYRILRYLR